MQNNLSYWEKTTFFNFDCIVIGSGIVGLNAAMQLKKSAKNLKIAVLERGFLPSGASTKNAGFACFGSVSELIEQEITAGVDGLASLIEKRWKGLLKLRSLLGDRAIDYQRLGGYELFKTDDEAARKCVAKIEHFNTLIAKIVGKDAFSISSKDCLNFGFRDVETLIKNKYEAQIDTGRMMFSLLQYAQSLGISILNNCTIERFDQSELGLTLVSSQGDFKCKKLIVATNAFTRSLLPEIDINPGRGQVLITKPIKGLKIAGTFHYDKGYYYFRNINNRILLGGGRNLDFAAEETLDFNSTPIVQKALEALLANTILPGVNFEIDYRWSGVMAFGKELAPLITEARPGIFCATRCNGMGIAIGAQTGEDIAELVLKTL